jgi:hypothetical protein
MSKLAEGAWFFITKDRYRTRGAEIQHDGTGWHAIVGRKVRGPISNIDAAMAAADRMLADSAHAPTERVIDGMPA